MEEALLGYMVATGSPILSRVLAAGVSWHLNDQGAALPRIALTLIDGAPEAADDGDSSLSSSRVQVDCFAPTFLAAAEVARTVKARLSGISVETGGVEFQGIYVESERSSVERFDSGETHRISLDLMVWHRSA